MPQQHLHGRAPLQTTPRVLITDTPLTLHLVPLCLYICIIKNKYYTDNWEELCCALWVANETK